ncbi:hypothetical protein ACGF5C_12535 [Micromonospora sp. NPDC047620]|uniref:hypothetical protein n=1 Tax=Micromonospora sp. NPDC047620 TaxID=3364251 RepID=UPI003714B5B4
MGLRRELWMADTPAPPEVSAPLMSDVLGVTLASAYADTTATAPGQESAMPTPLKAATALVTALLLVLTAAAPAQAATPYTKTPVSGSLRAYNVSGVYVAGVSSGGYMATQFHVAYSSRIRGAAVFAAGPYHCAQNNVVQALNGCGDNLYPTNVTALQAYTRTWAGYGWIDPVGNLSGDPVYVFHGNNDTVVKKSVTDDLVRYRNAGQCSALHGGGARPALRGPSRPEQCLTGTVLLIDVLLGEA